ncbi:DUF4358 domain-containing protein [Sutcliffiella halmapala]|uniref:DUF4358 domain-containing protein n=1 Tax=Sutcliffiella halmapala TaxID=79882 RepID=UPI0009949323|nr:DUF4358 domain-containing protein [Sutcliffiella halmapala]
MKRFSSLVMLSLLVFIFAGCGSNAENKEKDVNISTEEMLNEIKEQLAEDMKANGAGDDVYVDGNLQGYIEADLVKADETDPMVAIYFEKMQLNKEELASGHVVAAMMNVNSDEIFLFEAKEKEHVDSLKAALEREKEAQIQTWEQYLPDQYEKVKNNVIKTNGKYLLYVTAQNPDEIEAIFDSYFE